MPGLFFKSLGSQSEEPPPLPNPSPSLRYFSGL